MQMDCWCMSGTDDSFELLCVCRVIKYRPARERESAILGSIMFTHLHVGKRIWRQYLIAVIVTGVYQSCFEAWMIFHLSCVGLCFLAAVERDIFPQMLHHTTILSIVKVVL